jgi:hypothetical protein
VIPIDPSVVTCEAPVQSGTRSSTLCTRAARFSSLLCPLQEPDSNLVKVPKRVRSICYSKTRAYRCPRVPPQAAETCVACHQHVLRMRENCCRDIPAIPAEPVRSPGRVILASEQWCRRRPASVPETCTSAPTPHTPRSAAADVGAVSKTRTISAAEAKVASAARNVLPSRSARF